MRFFASILTALALSIGIADVSSGREGRPPSEPKNFVYFGRDRERIAEPDFLNNPGVAGAQLRYAWKELEPERDRYSFDALLRDIESLKAHDKRLFVQIQDASFTEAVPVPDYLRTDPAFSGGADRKIESGGEGSSKTRFDGWVARRWDPSVRERFIRLLNALGRAADGKIEGINLPETAIGFEDPMHHPKGFSFETYAAGLKELMTAARAAFPRSTVIAYANFMPGDPSQKGEPSYLRSIHAHAEARGVGVGGPDLLPFRKFQQANSLSLIERRKAGVVAGLAVQDGNLKDIDPRTGARVTVADLYRYATERLRLDYIFWGTEEPYYSKDVLPFLELLRER